MMRALFRSEGATLAIELLDTPAMRSFIEAHAGVLDSSFKQTKMSETMRRRLQRSDFIFSGMKTFHELNEAFPSLLDEKGNRKPFERFLNDVQKVHKTYNANYLRAEYNFVSSSAEMAAKWEGFMQDGDRYNLQYRTAKDDKVRLEHARLDGVTLPPSDTFWEEYFPPNGWNCRCTVVQVRKSKYPETPHDEAMARGEEALQKDTKGIFHFNPGKEQTTVPDYNPYTIRRCRDCDIAKGKGKMARNTPEDNELCEACRIIRYCTDKVGCRTDPVYGDRLLTHINADKTEIEENTKAAKVLLDTFPDMRIRIREHIIADGVKNPEYMINELIADRKGIMSEKGIASGFVKALKQGCKSVVIDLDYRMKGQRFKPNELAKRIEWRRNDFEEGRILECYVIKDGKAVKITSQHSSRELILAELQKLRP